MLLLDRNTGHHHDLFPQSPQNPAPRRPPHPQRQPRPPRAPLRHPRPQPAHASQLPRPHRPHRGPAHPATCRPRRNIWSALVRPSRKIQPGERLVFHAPDTTNRSLFWKPKSSPPETSANAPSASLQPRISTQSSTASATCRCRPTSTAKRSARQPEDRDRYQTVYAGPNRLRRRPHRRPPLHPEDPRPLKQRGVQIETITLHVGLGTFQPVRAERISPTSASTPSTTPSPPPPPSHQPRAAEADASSPPAPPPPARSNTAPKSPPENPRTPLRPTSIFISPRPQIPHRLRPAHQLPPPAIHAA
jgi:S-adenosylmethionine:tRNA ribosyltransferase-isomerase